MTRRKIYEHLISTNLFGIRDNIKQLKKGTLEFCGIKPVKVTSISVLKGSSVEFRQEWINKVYTLGKKLI